MPTYEENIALSKRGGGMAGIPDMSAYLGRPLTIGEERTLMHALEERMGIETEAKRLQTERDKILLEGEKSKQALIARAIESMTPGWERGGERVDVGGFSRGGAPMQQVAVGPGQPGREITPATGPGVQYRQPGAEQQRMGQQLVRHAMGLTLEDPIDVFDRKIAEIERKENLRATEARKTEQFRVGLETKRETAGLEKLGAMETAKAIAADKKEAATLKRNAQLSLTNDMAAAQKEYQKAEVKLKFAHVQDLTLKNLPPAQKQAQLDALKAMYESWIRDIKYRGDQSGISVDTSAFIKTPALSEEQIARAQKLKKANPKAYKAFLESYEQEHGKPFPLEVK